MFSSNLNTEENFMKTITTTAFQLTTATPFADLKDEMRTGQTTGIPVRRQSGDEEQEDKNVSEARLNRIRQNWYQVAQRPRSRR